MGKLRNQISSIIHYLIQSGFRYERFVCGGNYGYQKAFPTEDGLYYTWVHCDLVNQKLNIYKEYDCGGEVASYRWTYQRNSLKRMMKLNSSRG